MMFLWFLFLIPLVLWIIHPVTGIRDGGAYHTGHNYPSAAGYPDPAEIARLRLARGEITTSEYELIRRTIG